MNSRYRKIECLGSGGMGEVWLVHDDALGCYWAMKLLHEHIDTKGKKAFQRECKILTQLHHRAIPRIVDRVWEAERQGVIMDLVEGISLAKLPKPLDESQLLEYAKQLADVLLHIHEQGILYLDLKPENIMVDQSGQLHLIDFGIARFKQEQKEEEHYGTIGFACLEQYENAVLDERCDIYAFGKTLIALALGIHDGNVLGSLKGSDTNLSQGFRLLIDGCVAEDPRFRYQRVADILNDLGNMEKIRCDIGERKRRWNRTRTLLLGLGTTCYLVSITCLYLDHQKRLTLYENAMRNQDYVTAITLDMHRQEAFVRLYEDTYTEQLQALRKDYSFMEAMRLARSKALKRVYDSGICFADLDDDFLYQLAIDALLSNDETWLLLAQEALTYLNDDEDTIWLRQLCQLMQEGTISQPLNEVSNAWLSKSPTDPHFMELGLLCAQLYEFQAVQLSQNDYEIWQSLMEQLNMYCDTKDDERIDEDMRKLLYVIQAESYYQYGRYLQNTKKYEASEIAFDKLIRLHETMEKRGYQDETILYECGNSYLYRFVESSDPLHHLDWLKEAQTYYEMALAKQADFGLAQNGLHDCERLLAYWGSL